MSELKRFNKAMNERFQNKMSKLFMNDLML